MGFSEVCKGFKCVKLHFQQILTQHQSQEMCYSNAQQVSADTCSVRLVDHPFIFLSSPSGEMGISDIP